MTVISVNDGIEIKASKKIVLQAGQASVTLEGRDITFACPGTFSVKGGQHLFDGGDRLPASFVPLPSILSAQFSQRIRLLDEASGKPLSGMPYFMRLKSGLVFHGLTDDDGYTDVAQSSQAEQLETSIGHTALKKISKLKGRG